MNLDLKVKELVVVNAKLVDTEKMLIDMRK